MIPGRDGAGRGRHAASPEPATTHPSAETGFAWLRLIGALIVVVDHSAPLVDPTRLSIFPTSWGLSPGYIALMGFFTMSGYQIADSWTRDPVWWRYLAKRVLRIMPPLLVVVIVTALVIGPMVTTLSPGEYFSANGTWGYIANNSTLYLLQHRLPGVFDSNPYPWSANGSLWTLPMEFTGYLIVLVLGLAAMVTRIRAWSIVALIALVALDRRYEATIGYPGDAGSFLSVPIGSAVSFLVPFALGVVIYSYRDRISLSPLVAWSLVGLQVALHSTPVGPFVLPFMAGYGAVVLAHHWPARLGGYDRWVYGSYGLYVWAFPIQQLLVMAGLNNEWSLMAAALPLSYLFGLLSWRFIEEPTQSLRRYLGAPRRPPKVTNGRPGAIGPQTDPPPRSDSEGDRRRNPSGAPRPGSPVRDDRVALRAMPSHPPPRTTAPGGPQPPRPVPNDRASMRAAPIRPLPPAADNVPERNRYPVRRPPGRFADPVPGSVPIRGPGPPRRSVDPGGRRGYES